MEMPSVQCLKKFVNERLTAAAEEIFGVFETTLSAYEEEIVRQRRLLDIILQPEIRLQRTDVPQTCKEGVLLDWSTSLDQDDPEPPLIKEELCNSQEEEQLELEQETGTFKLSPIYDHSEDQNVLVDPDQTQQGAESQSSNADERMRSESDRKLSVVTEPKSDCNKPARTDDKQFTCTICGKSFSVRTDLTFHMKMHTVEKPYRCKYCAKEFAFSSSVSRHLRVHTGEKPYVCRLCGKRFNVSTTLKVHYRIHTGEKPYKCTTCERAFTTCSNLKKHKALHTEVGL